MPSILDFGVRLDGTDESTSIPAHGAAIPVYEPIVTRSNGVVFWDGEGYQ